MPSAAESNAVWALIDGRLGGGRSRINRPAVVRPSAV